MLNDRWTTQLRKGLAELILLRVLREGEAYGYEIMQRLAENPAMALGESTVYPLLGRLTRTGHLAMRVMSSETGPRRRYYRLTSLGSRQLAEMDEYWTCVVEAMERIKEL